MSKILAVFGATGKQGISVVNYVLDDAELSQTYKIRAITRNVTSDKAKQLEQRNIEVVKGDFQDRASLEEALSGVHTVFAMTTPSFGPDAIDAEFNSAKLIADVAVGHGVEYVIFSTLPSIRELSGGRCTVVTPFDAKAKAEQYIRGLPVKSAFVSLGFFMENFNDQPFLAPQKAADGTYVLTRPVSEKLQMPLIHAVGDTGKFVGAILAEPDKYEGKTFCAAAKIYSLEEMIAIFSKASGKTIVYKRVSTKEFGDGLAAFGLPGPLVDLFVQGITFQEELGYFGPESEKAVSWAVENARGRLSTLEEYLEEHPLQLN